MKGVCDNPNSYYYQTSVDEDFEPEECSYRRCSTCPHFISEESLKFEVEVEAELERERARIERLFGW